MPFRPFLPRPPQERSFGTRLAIALIATLLALNLRWLADPLLGERPPCLLMLPAIVAAAWLGGGLSGLIATALTAVGAVYLFYSPRFSFILSPEKQFTLISYLISGVSLSAMGALLHRGLAAERKSQREAARQFELMAEAVPVLVWATDAEGQASFFNKLWLEYRGSSLEREQGVGWVEGLPAADRETVLRSYRDSFRVRKAFSLEHRLLRQDGVERWVLNRGQPRFDAAGLFVGYIGACVDITEEREQRERAAALARENDALLREARLEATAREEASRAVAASEQRLRALAESNMIGLCFARPEGNVTEANDYFLNLLGYTREDVAAGRVDWRERTPAEWLEQDERKWSELVTTGQCAPFEKEFIRPDGQRSWVQVGGAMLRHSGAPECVAYVLDLTARKRAEEERRLSDQRFGAIVEQNVAGIVEADLNGRILRANARFCEITGRSESELKGLGLHDFTHPEDVPENLRLYRRLLEEGHGFALEKRYLRSDGSVVWVQKSVGLLRDSQGKPFSVVAICQDITAGRAAEEARERAERRFRALEEASVVGVFSAGVGGEIFAVNDAFLTMMGYARTEFEAGALDWRRFTPPEWLEQDERIIEQLKLHGRSQPFEKEYLRKDGTRVPVFVAVAQVPGTRENMCCVFDITERKQAEAALRASEERYRALVHGSSSVIWRCSADGREFDAPLWTELTGQTREEYQGAGFLDAVHPDDREPTAQIWGRCLATGEPVEVYYRLRHRSGDYRWMHVMAQPVRDDRGAVREWVGTANDIHEQRKVEEILQASELRYRTLVQATSSIVWSSHGDGRPNDTAGWTELTGQPREEVEANWLDVIHPEDRERTQKAFTAAFSEKRQVVIEYRIKTRASGYRWMLSRGVPVIGAEGDVREWIGTLTDIHDRISAEQTVRTSEERHRSLIHVLTAVVWTAGAEGTFDTAQESWSAYTGQRFEEYRGFGWLEALHPDDRAVVERLWKESVVRATPFFAWGQLWHAPSRSWRHFEARAVPLFHSDGSVREWIGTCIDVHDRRAAEENLRRQRELLRSIIDAIPALVSYVDADERYLLHNVQYEVWYGRSPHEIDGRTVRELVGEEAYRGAQPHLREALAGRPSRYERRLHHPDGSERYLLASYTPDFDENGLVRGAVIHAFDITDRIRQENQILHLTADLQARVAEFETLVSVVPVGIAVTRDPSCRTVTPNPTLARMLGVEPGDNVSMQAPESERHGRFQIWSDGRPLVSHELSIERAIRENRDLHGVEMDFRFEDGRRLVVISSVAPLRNVAGEAVGAVAAYVDISDRIRAEEALRQKDELLHLVINSLPALVSYVDTDLRYRMVNRHYEEIFRRPAAEFVGVAVREFVSEADFAEVEPYLRRALAGEQVAYERHFHLKNGRSRWLNVIYTPEVGPDGAVRGLVAHIVDVSERRALEQAVVERERELRTTMDAVPALIGYLDRDERYQRVNQAYETTHQLAREKILGLSLAELLGPAVRDFLDLEIKQVLAGRGVTSERGILYPDGRRRWMQMHFTPDFDEEGRVRGFISLAFDITHLKETEAALQEALERYRFMADSMPQIVWTARPNGYLEYYNRRWFEYTGIGPQQVYQLDGWKPVIHPDDAERCLRLWYACVRTGEPYEIEYRFRGQHDGAYRWHLGRALPRRDESGAILQWVGTSTDIHDQKEAQGALETARAELRRYADQLELRVAERTARLEEVNNELQAFTYSVSHDLRTPLQFIGGFSEALLMDAESRLSEPGKDYLQRIIRSSQRMDVLIRDLLGYSRLARAEVTLEPVSLDDSVDDVLAQQRTTLEEKQVAVRIDRPLGQVIAAGTPLFQALGNLVSNALKFAAKDRSPRLSLRSERREGFVRLWVEDNGIGIDPQYHERIFRMFERLHGGNSAYPGTGIGLSLVRKAMERMNGRAGVESELGRGSRFWIELPAYDGEPAAPDLPPAAP